MTSPYRIGDVNLVHEKRPLDSVGGIGACPLSGGTVNDFGNGIMHETEFTLVNQAVQLVDAEGTIAYGSAKMYDMPAGAIMVIGATSDIEVTKTAAGVIAAFDSDFGIGTAACAGDDSLTGTEDDVIPTTASAQAVLGETNFNAQSTAAENVVHDGTTTPKDIYLNMLVDDADHDVTTTPTNLVLNGTVKLFWFNLGDY